MGSLPAMGPRALLAGAAAPPLGCHGPELRDTQKLVKRGGVTAGDSIVLV